MHRVILLVSLLAAFLAGPALSQGRGDIELNVYMGSQSAPHSRVRGDHPDGGTYDALFGWQGKSFGPPPYYGLRATWWRNDRRGWAIELTHAKVYAPASERAAIGFDRFEFSDGQNLLTVNYMLRWPGKWGRLTPYAGAGLGIAVPHVDVLSAGGQRTYGYQFTGPAARLVAGASLPMGDRWSLFGEYQFTISQNSAELTGGGSLDTRIITNAVNFGLGIRF